MIIPLFYSYERLKLMVYRLQEQLQSITGQVRVYVCVCISSYVHIKNDLIIGLCCL